MRTEELTKKISQLNRLCDALENGYVAQNMLTWNDEVARATTDFLNTLERDYTRICTLIGCDEICVSEMMFNRGRTRHGVNGEIIKTIRHEKV